MVVKSEKNIHVYYCTIGWMYGQYLPYFSQVQLTQLAKCITTHKDPKTILSNLNKNTPHLNLCAPEMKSS